MSDWQTMLPRERDAWLQNHCFPSSPVVATDWPCGYDPSFGIYEASLFSGCDPDTLDICYADRGPVVAQAWQGWPPDERGYAVVHPVPFYSTDMMDAIAFADDLRHCHGLYVKIIMRPDSHESSHKWYCNIEDRKEQWCYAVNGNSLAEAIAECAYLAFRGDDDNDAS